VPPNFVLIIFCIWGKPECRVEVIGDMRTISGVDGLSPTALYGLT